MNGAVWKVCIQSEVERGGQEKSQWRCWNKVLYLILKGIGSQWRLQRRDCVWCCLWDLRTNLAAEFCTFWSLSRKVEAWNLPCGQYLVCFICVFFWPFKQFLIHLWISFWLTMAIFHCFTKLSESMPVLTGVTVGLILICEGSCLNQLQCLSDVNNDS